MSEAIRLSDEEATRKEQEDLMKAIVKSKSDAAFNKYEVLQMKECSAEITQLLLNSDELTHCRTRVANAGPEFSTQPEFAHGALILVPVTEKEVADAGLHLRPHHIVALPGDREHIVRALNEVKAANPSIQKRPKLKYTTDRSSFSVAANSNGSPRELEDEEDRLLWSSGCFRVFVER